MLVPDINKAESDFAAVQGDITFGLSAVRNVGEAVVEQIVREREEDGPYESFQDFANRVDLNVLNKRTVDSLIKGGAFDSLDVRRRGLFERYPDVLNATVARRRAEEMGQFSLFGSDQAAVAEEPVEVLDVEWDKKTKLVFEKEMLGLYVSDHPLLGLAGRLEKVCSTTIPGLWDQSDKAQATIAGIVSGVTRRYTRAGDLMLFFTFEDLQGSTEVVCFPRTVAEYCPLIREDAVLVVSGRVDHRGDDVKFIGQKLQEADLDAGSMIRLQVPAARLSRNMVGRLKTVLSNHPGTSPVYLHMASDLGEKVIKLGEDHRVEPRSSLYAELRELLGPSAVL